MSDLPKIIYADKFVQLALSYFADYVGSNTLSRDEVIHMCDFIFKFFGSGISLNSIFTLDQIRYFAYCFYSYIGISEMYSDIDKMFRDYKFDRYVYNE